MDLNASYERTKYGYEACTGDESDEFMSDNWTQEEREEYLAGYEEIG